MNKIFNLGKETHELVREVQRDKYMQPDELDWSESLRRVAIGVFLNEYKLQNSLYDKLLDKIACPAGRVLAGAGTSKNVTWWNCFVAPQLQDSMRTMPELPGLGIMECLADVAVSMQAGGGVGTDFSPLRPAGALVRRVQAPASGPLPFMDMWDSMCQTIMSAGYRRGAMMATLRCDHPDILKFIHAKQDGKRLRMFNISVLITDAFMQAKEKGETWQLVHPAQPMKDAGLGITARADPYTGRIEKCYVYEIVDARWLWNEIMRSTYKHAEPGVIFIDKVNYYNNLHYLGNVNCCNPCFSGDTKVWTAFGPKTFLELASTGNTIPVLTELEDGKLAFRNMTNPRKTRCNIRLVKVTFKTRRGGSKSQRISITELRCTASHEFYLKNGTKKKAIELVSGDRIESANRRPANQDYFHIQATNGDLVFEHHLISELAHGRRPLWPNEHAHHINENKKDNTPGNVEILSASKHNSEHMQGDNNPMRKWFQNTSEQRRQQYKENMHNLKSGENNPMFGRKHSEETKQKIGAKTLERNTDPEYKERWLEARNHEVVKVEILNEFEDVYCGTVPETGRFFVCLGDNNESVLVSNCGEQFLLPDENCNLSHNNLSRSVKEPFTKNAEVDMNSVRQTTSILVRMSDNIIDLSPVPTKAQKEKAQENRRIGLGITGLANMLMFLNIRYGSIEAQRATEFVMSQIRNNAYRTSIELAKEKGPFPAFDKDKYLQGNFIKTLPDDIIDGIATHGIRNSFLLTVAPTGTVSIAQADNASGGLEPVFAPRYTRKVLQPDNSFKETQIEDFGFRVYANTFFDGDFDAMMKSQLPDYMVTAQDLTPDDHLVMQACVQQYIDNSVSKTINVPTETSFEDFASIYDKAYQLGCKGCTTYRPDPDSGRGEVLSIIKKEETVTKTEILSLRERPAELSGITYKLRWNSLPYPIFLTINDEQLEDGSRIPFEVFINSKAAEHSHWIAALTRMISAVMRKGGDLTFIPEELEQVYSAKGSGEFIEQRWVPSEVALIGITLRKHFEKIGYIQPTKEFEFVLTSEQGAFAVDKRLGNQCPVCSQFTVFFAEGCSKCSSCNWSNCG